MRKRVAIALLLLIVPAGAAGQEDDKEKKVINVDFTVGWGGCYRPMEWTPVLIGITTPFKKPLDCTIRISAAQNDLNRLEISRREVLMPGKPKEIPLVTKLAYAVDQCGVTIYNRDTGFFWARSYELWTGPTQNNPLKEVTHKDILIGVSGRQGFGIMQLPRATRSRTDAGEAGKVFVKYKFGRVLPSDWTGYASLDLLVLYDPDWTQLTRHQCRAVTQYVTNGGRLMLVLGSRPLPENHPLALLLPFKIGPPREGELSYRTLRQWGCRLSDRSGKKVTCWSLDGAKSAAGWKTYTRDLATPLRAWGPAGFGQVEVVAFDPAAIGGRQDRNVAQFWVEQIGALSGPRQIQQSNDPQDTGDHWRFPISPGQLGSNAMMEYLYALEQLRPIHIGWVVLVLAGLAVLIGPVDYLVLKKLGRLPLTWVTASLFIAIFSVGAYYGVQYLRGGALQARVISVLDGVAGTRAGWATTYAGIFSPRSDDYQLTGLDRSQWWSGMAPTQGDHIYHFREQLGSRGLYCAQHIDGGNLPSSVPINIWSMQCLASEAPLEKMPLRAEVRYDQAKRQYVIDVENLIEAPIQGGYLLLHNSRHVPLGPVPGKSRREFRGSTQRWDSWESYVQRVLRHDETAALEATRWKNRTPFAAAGTRRRTEGIFEYLKNGAAVVCAEYDRAPVPFDVANRRCIFQHTQLARLVVFPETRK